MVIKKKIFPGQFKNSIAFRYLVIASTFLVIIQLLFGLLQIRHNFTRQLSSLEQKVERQGNFLSAVTPEAILSLDFLALERLMEETSKDADIVYSLVIAPNGRALTRFLDRDNPLIYRAIEDRNLDKNILTRIAAVQQNSWVDEIRTTIISEGHLIGEIRLGYSIENLQQEMFSAAAIALRNSIVVSILLTILTIILFNRQVRNPLRDLVKLSQQFAEGKLDLRAEIKRDDEIGKLKLAFNSMAVQLQNSLESYRSTFENAVEGIYQSTLKGQYIRVNSAMARIHGYSSPEQMMAEVKDIGQQIYVDSNLRDHFKAIMKEKGEVKDFQYQVYRHDGSVIWVKENSRTVCDHNGKLLYYEGIVEDITDRKQTEKALQQSEERFKSLVSNIVGAIYRCRCDANWTMEFISDAIEEISGYAASEFIHNQSRTYASIIHPDDQEPVEVDVNQAVAAREPFILEYRVMHCDGSIHWVYEKGRGIFDDRGNLL